MVDTSLLIYFFGKRGDGDLGFDDFKKFMDNLQTEVLQMEYNEFAKGCATITEMDFARLMYSQVPKSRNPAERGITYFRYPYALCLGTLFLY